MTSDQEAVCPECKHSSGAAGPAGICVGCPCPRQHPTLRLVPAPVVPSDDERCALPNSQWGVCGIPESAHADLMQPLAGSRFHHEFKRPAPPTPSQDAEGDGAALAESLWAAYKASEFNQPTSILDKIIFTSAVKEAFRAGRESSIRADYKELVEAATKYVQQIELERTNPATTPEQHAEYSAASNAKWDRLRIAALTRIEESLGGRK